MSARSRALARTKSPGRLRSEADTCFDVCCNLHEPAGTNCKSADAKITRPGTWSCMGRCLKLPEKKAMLPTRVTNRSRSRSSSGWRALPGRPRGWCAAGEHLCEKKTPGGSSNFCCCDSTGECVGGKIVLANTGMSRRARMRRNSTIANPLPEWCPSSIATEIGGKKWCFDPKTGGWICAEKSGSCDPDKGMRPWINKLIALFRPPTRLRVANGCYHPGKVDHPGRAVVACRMQNQGASPLIVQPCQVMQNPSPVVWAGIGIGALALAGGGGYWWKKRRQAAHAALTGVTVDSDCTKLTVNDSVKAKAYFGQFVDAYAVAAGTAIWGGPGAPASTIGVGTLYLDDVAPGCSLAMHAYGPAGVDTWQKAAIIGGVAVLAAGRLHDAGRLSDVQFADQALEIQQFLLEHGVDDLSKIEEVFSMPLETVGGGLAGPGGIAIPTTPRRQNVGVIGATMMLLGTAVAGGSGYAWWRNKQVTKACLGTRTWLQPDGKLAPEVDAELNAAIAAAIVGGKTSPVDIADSAIVEVAGNPECRLPKLLWGDLLRVRAAAVAKAVIATGSTPLPTPDVPDPEVVGFIVNENCTTITITDQELSAAYYGAFVDAQGLTPGMTWTPNVLMLAARFMDEVAPHCGIGVSTVGSPEIIGVDTAPKAVMVGASAWAILFTLGEKGIISEEDGKAMGQTIIQWSIDQGIEDVDVNDVILKATDDWGETIDNEMVDHGSVGGDPGGLWRVYLGGDLRNDEFFGKYYYKIWKKGVYTIGGPFDGSAAAKAAAISRITAIPAGVLGNPTRWRGRGATRSGSDCQPVAQGSRCPTGYVMHPTTYGPECCPMGISAAGAKIRDYGSCISVCPGGGHPEHAKCVAECAKRFPISAPKPESGGFKPSRLERRIRARRQF